MKISLNMATLHSYLAPKLHNSFILDLLYILGIHYCQNPSTQSAKSPKKPSVGVYFWQYRSVFLTIWHCILSAELNALLQTVFWLFCPLGSLCWNFASLLGGDWLIIIRILSENHHPKTSGNESWKWRSKALQDVSHAQKG